MPPSCALSGGFAIGARVALLWQHNANATMLASMLVLALFLFPLASSFYIFVKNLQRKIKYSRKIGCQYTTHHHNKVKLSDESHI